MTKGWDVFRETGTKPIAIVRGSRKFQSRKTVNSRARGNRQPEPAEERKKASSRQQLPVSLEYTTERYPGRPPPARFTWPYGHRLAKVDDPICGVARVGAHTRTQPSSPLTLARREIQLICVPCTPIDLIPREQPGIFAPACFVFFPRSIQVTR